MHFELSPFIVWVVLWIVKTYYKFKVNIFSNNRNITKCQNFCNNDNAKTITIPWVFSENNRAKKEKLRSKRAYDTKCKPTCECNTILSAYTLYRHLEWCLHSPIETSIPIPQSSYL